MGMKIVKLTERDLVSIVKKVINEQTNFVQARKPITGGAELKKMQQYLLNRGYDLGPAGADGVLGPRTKAAILKFQKTVGIEPTGVIDQTTRNYLLLGPKGQLFGQKYPLPTNQPQKKQSTVKPSSLPTPQPPKKNIGKKPPTENSEVSSQVRSQLEYLKKNKILGEDKFTILDDYNSRVHTFLPGYKLQKTYFVLTGKEVGDEVVINDFYEKLWNASKKDVKDLFNSEKEEFFKYMKECLYGDGYKSGDWGVINQTPSGIFRRSSGLIDTYENELARQSDEVVYGKKYISWDTLDNKEINTAWHGTELPERVKILTAKDIKNQNCKKRKMSKGCVNFKESDILEINEFVDGHQRSIWLPGDGKSIIEVPKGAESGDSIIDYLF